MKFIIQDEKYCCNDRIEVEKSKDININLTKLNIKGSQ